MRHHLPNHSSILEIGERFSCERAIDLQPVHEHGDCDETVRLDVLVEFVRGGLVENDGMVGLILDCVARSIELVGCSIKIRGSCSAERSR